MRSIFNFKKLGRFFFLIFFSRYKMSTSEMSTTGPGNTIAGPANIQGRNFLLTVNEKSLIHIEEIINYLENLKGFIYMLICEHIGQENKHYHIYIQFNNCKRLSFKKLFGSHVDKCFGSAQQNIAYVKAEDDKHKKLNITSKLIYESGEPKFNGGCKTIKQIEESTEEELKENLDPHLYNIAEKIKSKQREEDTFMNMLSEIENDTLKGPEVYYLTGPSGTGKTYGAYKLALSKYDKKDIGKMLINNNFFKITNEKAKCFVIEEFRPSQLHASDFLQLIDKYGFNCNIKGGFITIRPECFIICSIIPPEEIYKEEINEQFRRRLTEVFEIGENHELKKYVSIDDLKL